MAATFEHFEPHHTPWSAKMPPSLAIAPAVQTIIVDCVPIINP
jgi:hypothetical protein